MASSNTLVLYELGSRIKATRIQQGKSQTELAVAVGYDNSALSKIERGERVPDLITMGKIADELKVPMGAWFRPSLTTGTNTDLIGYLDFQYCPSGGDRMFLVATANARVCRLRISTSGEIKCDAIYNLSNCGEATGTLWIDCEVDYWI